MSNSKSKETDELLSNEQKSNNKMSEEDTPVEQEEASVPVPAAWISTFVLIGVSVGVSFAAGGLWIEFAIAFGIQYLVFTVYAWPFHSEKFYDFTGMITYISVTLYSFFSSKGLTYPSPRSIVLSAMVLIWTLRLGTFLLKRIIHDGGQDRRFDPIRNNFARFIMTWTFQGVWVFFCALPVLYVNALDNKKKLKNLYPLDYVGFCIWAFGFIFEVVGDQQKTNFKNNPENRGKFINTGLWSISRHPNYFGEITLWLGIALSACSVASNGGYIVLISPVWTFILLVFVSGIPLTEKRADKKYGNNVEYQEYKKNTPVLIPGCKCWTAPHLPSSDDNYQAMNNV